jgi:pimeloyl-CoA synthetase
MKYTTQKQYKKVTKAEARKTLQNYLKLKVEIKEREEAAKLLMEQLTQQCGFEESVIDGHKLHFVERASVSYSSAVKDLMPHADLSKYTNYLSYWRIG